MNYLLILILFFVTSCSYSDESEYVIEKKKFESFLELKVDSVTSLGLPENLMKGAKIIGIDGITVLTESFGTFSIH